HSPDQPGRDRPLQPHENRNEGGGAVEPSGLNSKGRVRSSRKRGLSCAAHGNLMPVPGNRSQSMIKLFFHPSPNPAKVALFLEEAGVPYEVVPVDTRKGEQFKPEFLAINPNAKTPAILDGDVPVFDSNAILLYLAEKTGKFLP